MCASSSLSSFPTRENLLYVFDRLPSLVLYLDRALCIRYCNRAFLLRLGLDEATLKGRQVQKVVGRKNFEQFEAGIQLALKGEIHDAQVKLCNATKERVWLHAHYIPDLGVDEQVVGCYLIMYDLSKQKQHEEALRESHALLEASQQVARLGSYRYELATDTWSSSAVLDEIFGIDESYPKTFGSWLELIHPEEQQEMSQYFAREVVGARRPFDKAYRIVHRRTGAVRWVHGLGELVQDEAGEAQVLFGTIQDITESQFDKRVLRLHVRILEMLADKGGMHEIFDVLCRGINRLLPGNNATIQLRDPHEPVLHAYASPGMPPAWIRMIDPLPIGSDVGSCGSAAFHKKRSVVADIARDARWKDYKDAALSFGFKACWSEPILSKEKELLGTFAIYLKEARAPYPQEIRLMEGVVWLAAIVIQSKQAEWELELHRQQLQQLVEERTSELEMLNADLQAFAYSISHDLRAPLRHIMGFTHLLQKSLPDMPAEGQEYFEEIMAASSKMSQMIEDLLQFSRLGRKELLKTPVDLNQLVATVITEKGPDTRGRSLEWKIGHLPLVEGDYYLLKMAFENLISNALKFTSKEAKAVIEIGLAPPDESLVVLYIRDNGVGFDMTYSHKLFGVFQRLHTSEEFEGTGIGLAHVKQIIHKHGGKIWAEGQPGQGATFYLAFPAGASLLQEGQ
ncbi:MAG: PAS domain S-box protein [Bacteroidetes bacterium]|nr:MAG: PAS domain S-box protein [Bacteroidota bacterium]